MRAVHAASDYLRSTRIWRATQEVDWARLNYVLIPSATYARQRPLFRPRRGVARLFYRILASFTPEGATMSVAMLIAAVFAGDIRRSQAYVAFATLASFLAAAWVASRFVRVPRLGLTVRAPRRVFVGDRLRLVLALDVTGAAGLYDVRVDRPFLPYFGKWVGAPPVLRDVGGDARDAAADGDLGGEAGEAVATTEVTFSRRGDLLLGSFRAAALGPMGLFLGPFVESDELPLRVVPRPARVRSLRTPRGPVFQPSGVALASKTGESLELGGVRPYRPGDRIRNLAVRAWARTGKPHVREYQEEYFVRVGVMLLGDGSRESAFEASIALVAGVVEHLARGEALIDVLVTGDELHTLGGDTARRGGGGGGGASHVTLGRHTGSFLEVLDILATVENPAALARTQQRAAGKARAEDAREALLRELERHLPRLSCVVMVTDAWGPAQVEATARVEARGVPVVRIGVDVDIPGGKRVASRSITAHEELAL
jgi:uncharacterized protein (DUF58 family)